jgi:hypothetical protein
MWRVRSRWLALLVAGPVPVLLAASCADSRGSLGDSCLKNQDCVSGVCAELVCAASPTYLEAEAPGEIDAGEATDGTAVFEAAPKGTGDASDASDASLDTTTEASIDAALPVDGSPETSTEAGSGSGPEAGVEAGSEAGSGAQLDAEAGPGSADASSSPEASLDAASDAHLDSAGD